MYELIYRIVKGSNAYNLKTGKEVLPLTDFVCFPKAHKLILEIFLSASWNYPDRAYQKPFSNSWEEKLSP